ncbi:type II secretion system minor pseudopilin GspI [Yersinia aleksiciae]|nr:type II secretion system minor pseudopilin GspI [Yersinia aleksiciae]
MVSLAIFALVGIGIMNIISAQVRMVDNLENRVISSWVAENIMSEIKIMNIEVMENWSSGEEFMMGKSWHWQSKEVKLQDDDIVTIIVEIRSLEDNITPDFVLKGYHFINE